MEQQDQKQQGPINIQGNGSNNNNFNIQTVKQIQHNHINKGGGGNGSGGNNDDGPGMAIALILIASAVVAATGFVYLRHHEQIFSWLTINAIASAIPYFIAALLRSRDPHLRYRHLLPIAAGMLLMFSQAWMVFVTESALPAGVLDIARQPTLAMDFVGQVMEVWRRFNDYGQRVITENWLAALALALAIFFNWLCGLRQISRALARSRPNGFWEMISRLLGYGDIRGGVMSAMLTLVAYLTVSGMSYKILHFAAV